jgi:hypothetical protein
MAAGSSAQFAIDIAARMSGGEYTSAQLDALTDGLRGAGKGAEHFQQAIQQVTSELSAAKAANSAAASALAEGTTQYRALETAAIQAAKGEERATKEAAKAAEALARVAEGSKGYDKAAARASSAAAAVAAMRGSAATAKAAVDGYTGTLQRLEQEAADASKAEENLALKLGNVRKLSGHADKAISGQSESLAKMQGSLSAVGGPLGSLGSKITAPIKGFADLSSVIGTGGAIAAVAAVGAIALAAAVVALAAAAVAGVVAIGSWAVGLADSARSAGLAQQAAEAMTPGLAGLQDVMWELEGATGVSQDSLRGMAKSLLAAKVSAKDLPAALEAAALAEAALGQGGASEFTAQIQAGKKSVQDLAAETKKQLGGIVSKQMLSLDAQSATLKRNVAGIFGGLNIDPVLSGISQLVALFDEGSASGESMRFLFETIFQPLIDQAKNAALVVEAFALGFLIGLTKVYIALKPAIKAIGEFFNFDAGDSQDVLDGTAKVAEWIAIAFVYAAAGVAALTAAFVAVAAAMAVPFLIVPALVVALVEFWPDILAAFDSAIEFIKSLFSADTWITMGTDLMMGLVNGITGSVGAVVQAVSGAVTGAIDTAKGLLGIHSPSKVFAGIGENTGEGFAVGVDGATADAQSAMAALVEPPELADSPLAQQGAAAVSTVATQASAQAQPTQASGASGTSLDLKGATFNFYGVEGADNAESRFGELLTRLLEGDATQLGGEAAPA